MEKLRGACTVDMAREIVMRPVGSIEARPCPVPSRPTGFVADTVGDSTRRVFLAVLPKHHA
ncbi:MAG TPA: hypothetical protein VFT74_14245 [Isosphaeraceae bacterium]|nr:hypothetical protein [Isosphaeraceae bacterium]